MVKSILMMNCRFQCEGWGVWVYLLDAVVEEGEAGILVADEGALLDEADEDLRLGQLAVELLVGAVAALQEPWRNAADVVRPNPRTTQRLSVELNVCIAYT